MDTQVEIKTEDGNTENITFDLKTGDRHRSDENLNSDIILEIVTENNSPVLGKSVNKVAAFVRNVVEKYLEKVTE